MLNLPLALLLFGLHDDKGTVHPAAFLALDHGLRGAALAELRLRGHVQTKQGGWIRLKKERGRPLESPQLDAVREVVAALPSPAPLSDWLRALQDALPGLRRNLIHELEGDGILVSSATHRALLPSSTTHPMKDRTVEYDMVRRLRRAIRREHAIRPRHGTLLGLVAACNLIDVVFPPDERAAATNLSGWVQARDAIVAAVRETVERVEGTWV